MPTYNRGEWGSLRAIIISHRWRQHIFFHQIQVFSCSVLMTCSPLVYCFLALTGTTMFDCFELPSHASTDLSVFNLTENISEKKFFRFTGNTLCNGDGQCLDQNEEWVDRARSSCKWELLVTSTIFRIYKRRCTFRQLWGKYSGLIR